MNSYNNIIDCDVHQTYNSHEELIPYLDEPWQSRVEKSGFGYPGGLYHSPAGGVRDDAIPKDGSTPGSDRDLLIKQHIEEYDIDYALLNGGGMLGISLMTEREYPAALARAYNDWLINEWLESDSRFLASIMVAAQNPDAAAAEIRRVGSHPQVVQCLLSGVSPRPYGQPFYHPIFEAIEEMELTLAFHPGGNQTQGISPPPTPVGYPSRYLEWHTLLPTVYMSQLTCMVVEGVFEKFSDLTAVFIEGGVGWLPHLMWRLDKNFKGLRSQAPWLEQLPSEYIVENCKFTTQPIEEPNNPEHLKQILDMISAEKTLMFSSDYPHWDFDDPFYALKDLSEDLCQQILYETAREVYLDGC
jgi:predicted TIM-barrel fold metal-dependent hydrolase